MAQTPYPLTQSAWGLSPYGNQPAGPNQLGAPLFQPILQSLQIAVQQLQQLQQVNYVQQQQLQQLQQWIQVVPQQIQQLQQQLLVQQSPFGIAAPALTGLATQPIGLPGISLQAFSGAPQPFPAQSGHVM